MFTVLTRQPCEQAGLKALSRTPAIIALVVLLLSVVVLVAITLIQIHQKEVLLPGLKYGIVLDAGSSRTTVYVYQWPAEKENNTGVVSQTCKCNVKEKYLVLYKRVISNRSFSYLQNSTTRTNLTNPCYPRNYITTLPWGHIFDSLCTEDLRPESYDPNDIITLEGTGDPSLCREKVASLFTFKSCPNREVCCFDGIYQPKDKGPFVAFAGFYYTATALNLSGSFPLNTFSANTWNFCSQSWSQLPMLLPHFEEVYARSYCFSAHYIYHLLVGGYKFTEETWPQIHFKKEVENSSIAWSLGYMLSLTNQIPAEVPLIRLPMKPPTFIGTVAFFAGMALLCLAFLVYLCVSSRNQRRSRHTLDHTVDSD
ncbi:PREDICTED: ectonucleoside triphosphate diphosphohydrolase 3 [Hipposideros armiger]|uniref:Ectonucleoside triphosphate diphosphohydrolase 3 n=1 Tax=Hipposideros armiger TaxID=186990 RepID=A0A8B7SZN5_HIPAR|nr:PREDICTED: ectonucleoside triphosphate diphosphohydrolase 3 [Hipposideros armiger]